VLFDKGAVVTADKKTLDGLRRDAEFARNDGNVSALKAIHQRAGGIAQRNPRMRLAASEVQRLIDVYLMELDETGTRTTPATRALNTTAPTRGASSQSDAGTASGPAATAGYALAFVVLARLSIPCILITVVVIAQTWEGVVALVGATLLAVLLRVVHRPPAVAAVAVRARRSSVGL
jgi:hypothetical protein